jgi:tripartite ATP-independent transporter DctP family solute receptor
MLRKSIAVAFVAGFALFSGASAQKVIKYAHFQPGTMDQPKQAAAVAFKQYVEKATNGSIRVDIYPASQLGDAGPVLEGVKLGTIQMAVVHDGPIAGFFKPIQVFAMPFVFESHKMAWDIWDGPYTKLLGEEMRKQTGIRMLALADNGVRHFTNDKRPIKSPADLKGLKMRIQPGPIYQSLVESFGASASAIGWAELPTALQSGVVDGQENGVTNILAASLFQYQKYVTLDGHVQSLHAYLINDRFFSGLSAAEKDAIVKGTEAAKKIHREMTAAQDDKAAEILKSKGMQVTVLTPTEIAAFRKIAQPPVRAFLEKDAGKTWVDGLMNAVARWTRENAAKK